MDKVAEAVFEVNCKNKIDVHVTVIEQSDTDAFSCG
jgi:hypothetical protein